jgi:hypothetical protein
VLETMMIWQPLQVRHSIDTPLILVDRAVTLIREYHARWLPARRG